MGGIQAKVFTRVFLINHESKHVYFMSIYIITYLIAANLCFVDPEVSFEQKIYTVNKTVSNVNLSLALSTPSSTDIKVNVLCSDRG